MNKTIILFLIFFAFIIFKLVNNGKIDFSSNKTSNDRSLAYTQLEKMAEVYTTKNIDKEKIGNFFINDNDQIIVGPNNIDYLCKNIFKSGKSCDDDEGLFETLLEMSNSDKNILLIHAEDLMKPIQFHAYDNGYIKSDKEARELTMKHCIDYASSLNLSENCVVIIQNNIIVNPTVEEYIRQNVL